jgi:hypothetical protein
MDHAIRYEVAATAKLLGGFSFQYTLRGDGAKAQQTVQPAPGGKQREAMKMVPFSFSSIALITCTILFNLFYYCVGSAMCAAFLLPSPLFSALILPTLLGHHFPDETSPLI